MSLVKFVAQAGQGQAEIDPHDGQYVGSLVPTNSKNPDYSRLETPKGADPIVSHGQSASNFDDECGDALEVRFAAGVAMRTEVGGPWGFAVVKTGTYNLVEGGLSSVEPGLTVTTVEEPKAKPKAKKQANK